VNIVFGHDEYIAGYVASNLGLSPFQPGTYAAIGFITNEGQLIGGAVFDSYNGSNVEVTIYAPSGLKRGVIRAIVHYAFTQLKCNRLSARTKKSNKLVQKILPKLGFKFEGIAPLYFGTGKENSAVMYGLDRATALSKWS